MKHSDVDLTRSAHLAIGAALLLSIQPMTWGADNAFSGSGPFGGRVSAVQFDPADANRAYANSNGNGMFFSDDGGATWQRFTVDHPDIAEGQIAGFGIDPNAPSTLWVVDGGSEVARTTDRGTTWTTSDTGISASVYKIIPDKVNSGTVFADATDRLFRSTDNGDTWTDVTAGLGDRPRVSIMQSPSDPNIFMALGWDGPFRSTDSGQTWNLVANNLPLTSNGYVFANHGLFDPNNSDVAIINVSNEGNWRTLDAGATWTQYGTNVPSDFFTTMIRDPSNSARIFLGTGNNDVFVSNNDGLSWGAADLSGLGEYTVNDIAFDPSNSSRMLIGTGTKGLFVSEDSGANWSLSTQGFVNVNVDAINIDSNDGRIYAGITGGVSTSLDNGLTWTPNEGNYDLQTFAIEADPLLANHAYAGSSCCGLYESFDAGLNWTRIDLQIPSVVATWVTDIDIPNSNAQQLLFSDYNRGLFGTRDGGATWDQLSGALAPFFTGNVVLSGVDAAESNNDIVFAVSPDFQRGGVFRSDDFGTTWTRKSGDSIPGPTRSFAIAIHPENPNIVFAGSVGLHRSTNGGDSWSLPTSGVPGFVQSIVIDQDDPQLMYAVSESSGLYRSVDGGENWVAAPDDGVAAGSNHLTTDPADRGRVLIGYDDVGYREITYSTDIELTDTTGPLNGEINDTLVAQFTVDSNGPITANSVKLETTIPSELSIVGATATTGTCQINVQSVSCALGELTTGAQSSVSVSVAPLADGDYNFEVNVTSLESDPIGSNNLASVSVTSGSIVDSDGDGIADNLDNCTNLANAGQEDADADGYGNACDSDFNNDCVVNFLDIAAFSNEFLGSNAVFDINSDGSVNFLDFVVVSQAFLQVPGPGLGVCN